MVSNSSVLPAGELPTPSGGVTTLTVANCPQGSYSAATIATLVQFTAPDVCKRPASSSGAMFVPTRTSANCTGAAPSSRMSVIARVSRPSSYVLQVRQRGPRERVGIQVIGAQADAVQE